MDAISKECDIPSENISGGSFPPCTVDYQLFKENMTLKELRDLRFMVIGNSYMKATLTKTKILKVLCDMLHEFNVDHPISQDGYKALLELLYLINSLITPSPHLFNQEHMKSIIFELLGMLKCIENAPIEVAEAVLCLLHDLLPPDILNVSFLSGFLNETSAHCQQLWTCLGLSAKCQQYTLSIMSSLVADSDFLTIASTCGDCGLHGFLINSLTNYCACNDIITNLSLRCLLRMCTLSPIVLHDLTKDEESRSTLYRFVTKLLTHCYLCDTTVTCKMQYVSGSDRDRGLQSECLRFSSRVLATSLCVKMLLELDGGFGPIEARVAEIRMIITYFVESLLFAPRLAASGYYEAIEWFVQFLENSSLWILSSASSCHNLFSSLEQIYLLSNHAKYYGDKILLTQALAQGKIVTPSPPASATHVSSSGTSNVGVTHQSFGRFGIFTSSNTNNLLSTGNTSTTIHFPTPFGAISFRTVATAVMTTSTAGLAVASAANSVLTSLGMGAAASDLTSASLYLASGAPNAYASTTGKTSCVTNMRGIVDERVTANGLRDWNDFLTKSSQDKLRSKNSITQRYTSVGETVASDSPLDASDKKNFRDAHEIRWITKIIYFLVAFTEKYEEFRVKILDMRLVADIPLRLEETDRSWYGEEMILSQLYLLRNLSKSSECLSIYFTDKTDLWKHLLQIFHTYYALLEQQCQESKITVNINPPTEKLSSVTVDNAKELYKLIVEKTACILGNMCLFFSPVRRKLLQNGIIDIFIQLARSFHLEPRLCRTGFTGLVNVMSKCDSSLVTPVLSKFPFSEQVSLVSEITDKALKESCACRMLLLLRNILSSDPDEMVESHKSDICQILVVAFSMNCSQVTVHALKVLFVTCYSETSMKFLLDNEELLQTVLLYIQPNANASEALSAALSVILKLVNSDKTGSTERRQIFKENHHLADHLKSISTASWSTPDHRSLCEEILSYFGHD